MTDQGRQGPQHRRKDRQEPPGRKDQAGGEQPQARPARHDTDVRRRKGAWQASCTCGWTADSVSAFAAWSATRRHLADSAPGGPRRAPPRRPNVRLLEPDGT